MNDEIYTLPWISFVGGESGTWSFNLKTESGTPFDADGCAVDISVLN
jgi:hypothetical protein